ncbi:hypothetical protein UFOVP245_27 [uncultured Caudovirales phage]|uniref:Uncharacterized protein n=1 Tax=uncultured Caudovirales phage TaxID=2100421 RepID=A0A6J7WS44_9CAUD|nr:hypothetical protein UFOVP245_27 [uncultured Caudovirales phage]
MSQIGSGGFAGSGIGAKGADTNGGFVSGTNGGTGGWGGVGQRDYGDLEWRLNQMQQDMKFMWNRLADLEAARDEKVEPNQQAGIDEYRYSMVANSFDGGGPYDVMDSFRATKPDAGEPANRYFVDCLKENAKLIEENDVLRYQYEAMKNETARCKGLFDQLVKENQRLEEDIRGAHERVKELDKPYATQLNDYIDALASIAKMSKELDELTKKYEGEKAAAIGLEESSTYWQQNYNEQLQETDSLNKRLDFFEKMSYDLEMEKKDAKWYREQAINKCIDIVERIKNDPSTVGYGIGHRWTVVICEYIQQAIKKEFGVK